jgi:hypothetical protein
MIKSDIKKAMQAAIEKIMQFGLEQDQAGKIIALFSREVILKRNDFWIEENNVCEHLGIITEGMCRHFYMNENGDEITRWVSLESDYITSFGSFIRGTKTNEHIQAIKPSKILVVHKDDWDAFYENHEFARIFWARVIEQHLIGMEERIFSLISLNAKNRFEYLKNAYTKLFMNVPDKYLASILGINPPTSKSITF